MRIPAINTQWIKFILSCLVCGTCWLTFETYNMHLHNHGISLSYIYILFCTNIIKSVKVTIWQQAHRRHSRVGLLLWIMRGCSSCVYRELQSLLKQIRKNYEYTCIYVHAQHNQHSDDLWSGKAHLHGCVSSLHLVGRFHTSNPVFWYFSVIAQLGQISNCPDMETCMGTATTQ